MVDPLHFTNYKRNTVELEEMLLFSILVAGKNALTTARCLENMLITAHRKQSMRVRRPFKCLQGFTEDEMSKLVQSHGMGCYKSKGKSLYQLVNSDIDLRECTFEDITAIHGIGFKTAEMFLMHSRKEYVGCALDVHILRYMREEHNLKVPKNTPGSLKKYMQIKDQFLKIAQDLGEDPTDLDLKIWRKYSGREVA